jgi:hypothetical protein
MVSVLVLIPERIHRRCLSSISCLDPHFHMIGLACPRAGGAVGERSIERLMQTARWSKSLLWLVGLDPEGDGDGVEDGIVLQPFERVLRAHVR